MSRWVLLLRGINVGGTGKLTMAQLRDHLVKLGARDVATYIQSGNAVFSGPFDAPTFEARLADEIEEHHGFRPRILLIRAADFDAMAEAWPWPEAWDAPKTGHVFFLESPPPAPDLDGIAALASATEAWTLAPRAFYLHAPEGIGRSALAAKVEARLGVAATARNLNTVAKLRNMVAALAEG